MTVPSTYVLLHGAWHGGWCWKRVAEPLRAEGHAVYTPTQTGLGERSHLLSRELTLDVFVQDVVHVLEFEDLRDVVLVGHSFGGFPISGVAERLPDRVRHLVYLDALVPESGRSPMSLVPPETAAERRRLAQASSGGLSIPVPDPSAFGVTDAADAAWLRARCTPHPLSAYESTLELRHPPGNGLPATYVAVTPYYAPTASSRERAKRLGWRYLEMQAGHDAMVTSPRAVIELLRTL